jgi:hypothetical protein
VEAGCQGLQHWQHQQHQEPLPQHTLPTVAPPKHANSRGAGTMGEQQQHAQQQPPQPPPNQQPAQPLPNQQLRQQHTQPQTQMPSSVQVQGAVNATRQARQDDPSPGCARGQESQCPLPSQPAPLPQKVAVKPTIPQEPVPQVLPPQQHLQRVQSQAAELNVCGRVLARHSHATTGPQHPPGPLPPPQTQQPTQQANDPPAGHRDASVVPVCPAPALQPVHTSKDAVGREEHAGAVPSQQAAPGVVPKGKQVVNVQ